MGKIWLGGTELKRVWCGQDEIVKIWQGSTLIWQKSGSDSGGGDSGGGDSGGGTTTHVLVITGVDVADIPANGGSVNTCTVYYTLDGVAKQTTSGFRTIEGGNLGVLARGRTQLTTESNKPSVYITDSGASDTFYFHVYQQENKIESYEIVEVKEWNANIFNRYGKQVLGGTTSNTPIIFPAVHDPRYFLHFYAKQIKRAVYTSTSKGNQFESEDNEITPTAINGNGNYTISNTYSEIGDTKGRKITYSTNTTGAERSGAIVPVYNNGQYVTIWVKQKATDEAVDYISYYLEDGHVHLKNDHTTKRIEFDFYYSRKGDMGASMISLTLAKNYSTTWGDNIATFSLVTARFLD